MKIFSAPSNLLQTFGPLYGVAFFFSLFINLLSLAVPLHMLLIFDRVFTGGSAATLTFVTVIALGALLVMGVLEGLRSRLLTRLSLRLDAQLTEPVLLAMFAPQRGGEESAAPAPLYSKGASDINAVKNFLGGAGIFAFFDLPWLPIYLAVSFILHPVIGWVSLGGAVILLGLMVINENLTRRVEQEFSESSKEAGTLLQATQRNVHSVYAMGMLPAIVRKRREFNSRDLALETKVHHRTGTGTAINRAVRMSLQAVILSVGATLVIANEITVGVMIVGSIMMGKALQPLDVIMAGWKQFQQARIAAVRLKAALTKSPKEDTGPAPGKAREQFKQPPAHGLWIENLRLKMGQNEILKGVNLHLKPGRVLGVIGDSGSGKTSLARCIIGLYPASGGRIVLDGRELSSLPEDDKGRLLGYLPQDVELMPVTVGENIGRLDGSNSETIIEAAKMAGAHEMILRLPNGYDTPVLPRAVNLSAGQRQRIALARALYGKPRLLILDEPDANLDDEGGQALVLAIKILREIGSMVMVISHRDWLPDLADDLWKMEAGRGDLQQTRELSERTS